MYSRWFDIAVVLLWLASMSWLVVEKVLPSLVVGEPPSQQRILAAQQDAPAVGWDVLWNDRPIGWAVSLTEPLPDGMTEVKSLVHFNELRLAEMVPQLVQKLLGLDQNTPDFQMEARSTLVFDSFGHLSRFESVVGFPPAAETLAVKVRGQIDGAELRLAIHCPDFPPIEKTLKIGNAMLSDAMSPQSHLPGLREGQEWTVEVYSPLSQSSNPTEILHARVETRTPILWNDRQIDAWLVVFRGDPGSRFGSEGDMRGKMWVSREGVVLKQQVTILRSSMTFVRLSDRKAESLVEKYHIRLAKDGLARPGATDPLDPTRRP
ncbi:MAG: hypothetical protein NUV77_05175 [Thermoguttaceae bacterium]|jgi:hypothetical protein|nr:hypothetical protein [Thermoguttaceae bacterium]